MNIIKRLYSMWQKNRAFKALNEWDGYYKLPIEKQIIINRALDILRGAQQ